MARPENKSSLFPTVRRLLAAAERASSQSRADRIKSRLLALVPIATMLLLLSILMPRSAAPDALPLPQIDAAKLDAVEAADAALVRDARRVPLAPELLLVGTAMRELFELEVGPQDPQRIGDAKSQLVKATHEAFPKLGERGVLQLRAVQSARFIEAVRDFERTGKESGELVSLGGAFVRRMREVGWIEGHRVLIDPAALRVAYKLIWNHRLALDSAEAAPSLDEMRALYMFYLTHPHPPDAQIPGFEEMRAAAKTPEACADLAQREATARHQWRIDKIKRLAAIDPTYPGDFALGVAHYQAKSYALSVHSFREVLRKNPDGSYAGRAQNHLKAALAAEAQ